MTKKLTFSLFTTGTLIFLCSMVLPEKSGDTWWYVHGVPYYWYYQPDVYAFRCVAGRRWSESFDTNCVAYHFHRDMHRDKLNIIYFKPGCTDSDKEIIKYRIRSDEQFAADFPVITLYPQLPYDAARWFVLDDLLLVNFNPDSLNKKRFREFKEDYGLRQINFPDSVFPEGIFTYIFEFDIQEALTANAIDLSKNIYLQDSGLVTNVQPNLINAYEKASSVYNNPLDTRAAKPAGENMEYHLVHRDNKTVKLYVKFKGEAPQTVIRIYDLVGREISSVKIKSAKIEQEISISDYVGGIYFATIENERGDVMGVQKFVKL